MKVLTSTKMQIVECFLRGSGLFPPPHTAGFGLFDYVVSYMNAVRGILNTISLFRRRRRKPSRKT